MIAGAKKFRVWSLPALVFTVGLPKAAEATSLRTIDKRGETRDDVSASLNERQTLALCLECAKFTVSASQAK
jgi:hypothetical protein